MKWQHTKNYLCRINVELHSWINWIILLVKHIHTQCECWCKLACIFSFLSVSEWPELNGASIRLAMNINVYLTIFFRVQKYDSVIKWVKKTIEYYCLNTMNVFFLVFLLCYFQKFVLANLFTSTTIIFSIFLLKSIKSKIFFFNNNSKKRKQLFKEKVTFLIHLLYALILRILKEDYEKERRIKWKKKLKEIS